MEGADWPAERFAKIVRNYAMEYVRSALPELVAGFGAAEARHLGGITGRLIGMQYYAETAALLGVASRDAVGFAEYLTRFAEAQGDRAAWTADGEDVIVEQATWRLMDGVTPLADAAFDAWNELWVGALSVHHRRLVLDVERRIDRGDGMIRWRIRRRAAGAPS